MTVCLFGNLSCKCALGQFHNWDSACVDKQASCNPIGIFFCKIFLIFLEEFKNKVLSEAWRIQDSIWKRKAKCCNAKRVITICKTFTTKHGNCKKKVSSSRLVAKLRERENVSSERLFACVRGEVSEVAWKTTIEKK